MISPNLLVNRVSRALLASSLLFLSLLLLSLYLGTQSWFLARLITNGGWLQWIGEHWIVVSAALAVCWLGAALVELLGKHEKYITNIVLLTLVAISTIFAWFGTFGIVMLGVGIVVWARMWSKAGDTLASLPVTMLPALILGIMTVGPFELLFYMLTVGLSAGWAILLATSYILVVALVASLQAFSYLSVPYAIAWPLIGGTVSGLLLGLTGGAISSFTAGLAGILIVLVGSSRGSEASKSESDSGQSAVEVKRTETEPISYSMLAFSTNKGEVKASLDERTLPKWFEGAKLSIYRRHIEVHGIGNLFADLPANLPPANLVSIHNQTQSRIISGREDYRTIANLKRGSVLYVWVVNRMENAEQVFSEQPIRVIVIKQEMIWNKLLGELSSNPEPYDVSRFYNYIMIGEITEGIAVLDALTEQDTFTETNSINSLLSGAVQ